MSEFDGQILVEAIRAAFDRRKTRLPEVFPQRVPLDWAKTQYNLGNALLTLVQFSKSDQALIARHFVEHDREGFARVWLTAQELSWAADLLEDVARAQRGAV